MLKKGSTTTCTTTSSQTIDIVMRCQALNNYPCSFLLELFIAKLWTFVPRQHCCNSPIRLVFLHFHYVIRQTGQQEDCLKTSLVSLLYVIKNDFKNSALCLNFLSCIKYQFFIFRKAWKFKLVKTCSSESIFHIHVHKIPFLSLYVYAHACTVAMCKFRVLRLTMHTCKFYSQWP